MNVRSLMIAILALLVSVTNVAQAFYVGVNVNVNSYPSYGGGYGSCGSHGCATPYYGGGYGGGYYGGYYGGGYGGYPYYPYYPYNPYWGKRCYNKRFVFNGFFAGPRGAVRVRVATGPRGTRVRVGVNTFNPYPIFY